MAISRRSFVAALGGTGALGALTWRGHEQLLAQAPAQAPLQGAAARRADRLLAARPGMVRLDSNENPYGAGERVFGVIRSRLSASNRYPVKSEDDLAAAIAAVHGVRPENVILGTGSGELLRAAVSAFCSRDRALVAPDPTFEAPANWAKFIGAPVVAPRVDAELRLDLDAMADGGRNAGLVYLCNPNNPTGVVVTKQEIKQLLDGLPAGMPVLIDEAYHHYVDDPNYATSMPYVNEGRPVVVARTFSKIAAMAAMRIGYAVAPTELLQKMRPYSAGSVNVLARYGAAQALKDKAAMEEAKRKTNATRNKTMADLKALGYEVIPSQANFFMVGLRRDVQPVIAAFREEGVLVGRPFPPMTQHLRVSVGVPEEMDRFMVAFKKVMATPVTTQQQR